MKKVVEKSKQTVWVLTMLTVMVVLSAYYLVTDPMTPASMVNDDVSNEELVNVTTEEIVEAPQIIDELGTSSNNDLFVDMKLERNNLRSKQLDEYYAMLKSDISEEAILDIQDKIDQMQAIEESEFVLEKLIVAEKGFNDAIVLTKEKGVDVLIQTSELNDTEAVKIIKMVSERLNIPAVNVHLKPIS